jgi:Ca-activated chloride channel family protein
MNCVREDLKAHITDVLVGEADAAVSEQVLAHLETCASCREDRDGMARVLGLLKEAPPWAGTKEGADQLSVIQRQKVSSLASRQGAAPPAKKSGLPMSWLALAASLSVLGIALTLARRSAEILEAPKPASATSSAHALPQAPEGPMLPNSLAAASPQSYTTPAAERSQGRAPVPVAPEAMAEFKRQIDAEQGKLLAQAPEANEQALKKDKDARNEAQRMEGGVAGGVAGGVVGGLAAEPPAVPAPTRVGGTIKDERAAAASAESRYRDTARPGQEETDRLKALGYTEPRRLDQPAPATKRPRDMFFESKGTNPFVITEDDPQSTFGLDVDTASYTLTRNYLNRGLLPPSSAVRVEEFVNAFPNNVVNDGRSGRESVFAVRADGAPDPLHPGFHILRVALKAKEVDPRERKAAHLTFVIDVSGSMARENRLALVKRSLGLLVDKLDERDTIGIVVYGTNGRRVLPPTSADNRERIMGVIDSLHPEGSTNLQDGLVLGYEMAGESFTRGASNRVVLCTDGVANTGEVEADALLARIRTEAKRGIDMMALGFGMGNYNDALLQRLADEGNGQYAYIDDLGEARAFFLRRLTSVLEVVARDAKAQVEFNPARVERYRLLGYEKRDVADRDFRNDAVDAGEINAGHAVTALFEVKLTGHGSGRLGVARIRYKTGPKSEAVEYARDLEESALARSFDKATPAFRTAYVAARFAEHLRQSPWVKDESLASLQSLADELPESQPTNELADLIRKATRLLKPREPGGGGGAER